MGDKSSMEFSQSLLPSSFPRTHLIFLLSSALSPLLGSPGASEVSNEFVLCPPPTVSPFSEKIFKWLYNGEEEKLQSRLIYPISSGSPEDKHKNNNLHFVC